MRVLVVNHYPLFGGPHNEIVRLAPYLRDRGIHFVSAIPTDADEAGRRLGSAGVDVVRIPLHRRRATVSPRDHVGYALAVRRDVAELMRVIEDHSIDLVQISGLVNRQGALAARRSELPLVWQLVDSRTPRVVTPLFTRAVVKHADSVLITGRSLLRMHPGLSRVGSRIVPYLPPVDTGLFAPDPRLRSIVRDELGVEAGSFFVASVGNLTPQKGHEFLISAFEQFRVQDPSAALRILGATSNAHRGYEARLRAAAAPFDDRVLVSGREVHRFLTAPDVFVLSAVGRSEGISTVILEAMAAGLPVIASDVGSLREVVEDGVTGWLVPPGDTSSLTLKLRLLREDGELRRRLGTQGRERAVARFGIEVTGSAFERAYEVALAHHRER